MNHQRKSKGDESFACKAWDITAKVERPEGCEGHGKHVGRLVQPIARSTIRQQRRY